MFPKYFEGVRYDVKLSLSGYERLLSPYSRLDCKTRGQFEVKHGLEIMEMQLMIQFT